MIFRRTLLLVLVAIVAQAVGGSAQLASALAVNPIERIWSFNGGEVAIQARPDGTFVGTVVSPTRFARCTHPDGQEMWTEMRLQPDGSYWGLHHWYFETSACVENPKLGPTAWRVMQAADGSSYLLACFSPPEGMQPTIAPSGATANVGYECVHSAEIAPVARADAESFHRAVSLPPNRECLSHRAFEIHLHEQRFDPFRQVEVVLGKRRLAVRRHGNVFAATIDLRGLPRGTFTVKVRVTTVLGHRLSGSRTYHTCAGARKPGRPKPLERARPGGQHA
jgi:hypothetical protein